MNRKPPLTLLEAVLIFLTFIVWMSLFSKAVVKETRMERAFVLDNTGQPVEIYVWEQGKGFRPPTQEEEEYDLDRREGEQR